MIGYRLIYGHSLLLPRSFCPSCNTYIKYFDLIPIISWLILKAKCRNCKEKISYLYPLIELLTALVFLVGAIYIPSNYWLYFFIFFSALIISIRTDLDQMLISDAVTLWLIPIALIFAIFSEAPISFTESIFGAITGYLILWSVAKVFYALRNKEGIGEGDFYLLAFIGAFIGPLGALISLFIGSFLGTIVGIIVILNGAQKDAPIPFGPFLALGAIIYSYFLF